MDPAQLRFLIVDAAPDARRSTRELLGAIGCHDVDEAPGCTQALARLKVQRFDLVIAAAGLPGISGFDLLHAVRADPALRHLPVLMLVAPGKDDCVRAVQAGAVAYLVAPFGAAALADALRQIVSRRGAPARGAAEPAG